MKERPILFSAPMVKALLDGTKTQTRRAWRVQPPPGVRVAIVNNTTKRYGGPGDRLWVRENCRAEELEDGLDGVRFADDFFRPIENTSAAASAWVALNHYGSKPGAMRRGRTVPSIHMPRWACRITLDVTEVRLERLQAISEADALAEGVKARPFPGPWWQGYRRMDDGELIHQQHVGAEPPDWMVEPHPMSSTTHLDQSAVDGFRSLWISINGTVSWDANPWVEVIGFTRSSP